MHVFLTGEIQVGKTTVIAKTIQGLQMNYGGFKTYFGKDRKCDDRFLYLNSVLEPNNIDDQNRIVEFRKDQIPIVSTQKFDSDGVRLIKEARSHADLIVMDECGNLENEAIAFQHEILAALDQDKPILGVIKLASSGWTDLIRNHKKVALLTVTKENREQLPEILILYFTNKK